MRIRRTVPCLLICLALLGCQSWTATNRIDVAFIPGGTYEITVYKGPRPQAYAALFAVPDDGSPVIMYHSEFTEEIGLGSPADYISFFETKIKGYKSMEIRDRKGNLRAYFLIYNFLYYEIRERPRGEGIVVFIEPPHLLPVEAP